MLQLEPDEYNKFFTGLRFVLDHEGGYVNDPKDPGGETKWGIAKRYHPDVDIKNLTPEQATEIYYTEYWVPGKCSDLNHPLCVVQFDTCVNMGVGVANTVLKRAGLDANIYIQLRRQGYIDRVKENPVKQKFLAGWLNRLSDLQKYIQVSISTP
jgi:lysozyme family protein